MRGAIHRGVRWPAPPPPGEPCYVCGCKVAPDGACAYNSAHMPQPEECRELPDPDGRLRAWLLSLAAQVRA